MAKFQVSKTGVASSRFVIEAPRLFVKDGYLLFTDGTGQIIRASVSPAGWDRVEEMPETDPK